MNTTISSFWKVGKELRQDGNYVLIDVFIFENDVKWNLKSKYYYSNDNWNIMFLRDLKTLKKTTTQTEWCGY